MCQCMWPAVLGLIAWCTALINPCTTLMSLRDWPVWRYVSAEGRTAFRAHRVKLVCPSATSVKPSRATASDRTALGR